MRLSHDLVRAALCLGFAAFCGVTALAHAEESDLVSRADVGEFSEIGSPNPFALGLAAGAGQVNSVVSRDVGQALGFGLNSGMLELAIGSSDPALAELDFFKATYFSPNFVQGSFDWFGIGAGETGVQVLPFDTKFLESATRGYLIYRPSLALQEEFFALRAGPMAGRGYGVTPDGSGALMSVGFAGFDLGVDGKLSTRGLSPSSHFRLQAGASVDLYEDLTGHLGQVAAAGRINNDTMTGLAYAELVLRTHAHEEWALGWKASYDRLTPYDPSLGAAARNEDTTIGVYLRWSSGSDVGSPVAGATF